MAGMERLLDEDEEVEGAELQEPDLRMVLVGKTGAGKSAAGNTILSRKVFESRLSPSTVTQECQKKLGEFEGKTLAVIDTPGLLEAGNNQRKARKEIATCISLAAPGPHVFLVVIQAGRFIREDQKTVRTIQKLFGKCSPHYTMALFTHGDNLEGVTIEDFIEQNTALDTFIHQCDRRYHVFNNRTDDPAQVRELLEKINTMVERNTGSCFTNELFAKAEKAIQEEMERLLRENPEMTRRAARRRAERKNKFIEGGIVGGAAVAGVAAGVAAGIGVEAAVGGAVGAVGGPVGAAVGLVVGAIVGAVAVLVRQRS